MQHDVSAFRISNTDAEQDADVDRAPAGVTPGTVRGLLIGLPIAAVLWGIILVAIWMVFFR